MINIVEPSAPPAISSAPAAKSVAMLMIINTPPMMSRMYDSGSFARQRYIPPMVMKVMSTMKLQPSSAGEPSGFMNRYSRTQVPNDPAVSKTMSVQNSATRRHVMPAEIARNCGDVFVYQSADRCSRESFPFFLFFRAIDGDVSYCHHCFYTVYYHMLFSPDVHTVVLCLICRSLGK